MSFKVPGLGFSFRQKVRKWTVVRNQKKIELELKLQARLKIRRKPI